MNKSEAFATEVANTIIESLENGTAPWIRPWTAEDLSSQFPYNPTTSKAYNGINMINLFSTNMKHKYNDPRWLTYKQAKAIGAQVRSGEKGETILHWNFSKQIDRLDVNGKVVFGEDGKKEKIEVKLERPTPVYFKVFNAAQIDGLEPLKISEIEARRAFKPFEAAENILRNSGAEIVFQSNGRSAHYNPGSDRITLPQREQFKSASLFYGTALHELGHWTGHKSRLNRDLSDPFGSEGYAKEELRAEISSFIMCAELGLDFDPGHHISYVASWVKALKEQPKEIFRAASDATKIFNYVNELNHVRDLSEEKSVESMVENNINIEGLGVAQRTDTQRLNIQGEEVQKNIAAEKTLLFVPYAEKEEAKNFGAKWDKEQKTWYIDKGVDLDSVAKWSLPAAPKLDHISKEDPSIEFANVLAQNGLILEDDPQMDGKLHRVKVESDKGQEKSGAYLAHLDGRPAGYFQNYKTGIRENWKASAYSKEHSHSAALTLEQLKERSDAFETKALEREKEIALKHEEVSTKVLTDFKEAREATNAHPYLLEKGIQAHGLKLDERGNLFMPLRDIDGKVWSAQHIGINGYKRLEPGGKKESNFYVIGEDPSSSKALLVCEGFATGASIHEATNKCVVVAVDAGNLENVTKALRERYPDKEIFLAADNDMKKELEGRDNVGRIKAEQAAEVIKGSVIVPILTSSEIHAGKSDFNDIHKSRGLEEVKKQIEIKMDQILIRGDHFKPMKDMDRSDDKHPSLDLAR